MIVQTKKITKLQDIGLVKLGKKEIKNDDKK